MRFTFFPTSRRAERGQALLETTIFLPVFLLGMYGVFWSVKQGALSERVQLGVRYGGVVSTLANPYDSYSLYALYATIDGHPPNGVVTPGSPSPCFRPDPSEVNSGRSSFWAPGALTPAAGSCIGGVETVSGPEAFTQPVLIQANFDAITAQAPVEGYLAAGAFGGQTGASQQVAAQQNFFRSPDVGTALQCANGGIFIKESLEPAYDSSVPNPATPLPLLVTPVTIFNAGNTCATFSPAPSAAPATPPPTGPTSPPPTGGCGGGSTPCPGGSGQTSVPTTAPSSSAAPTSTPTAKPTASPSPVPTATPTPTPTPIPKPTPTPVPTATPTPTAKPTATPTPKPTPTPTAKPTATPIPTATPKPTATPTPTPTPSPTPKPTASPTPTAKPTASPTPTASPVPTPTKSPTPSPSPTPVPTPTPTTKPTSAPTFTPSPTPTPVATAKPTATPVSGPTPPPGGGF